jgi:phosphomannomutase
MEQLNTFIKAYDVRGLVGSELTPSFTHDLGKAFATFLIENFEPTTIVVGEDMRPSSPELADAFSQGVISMGLNVIRIGLASTDMLYFASGIKNLPGAMFTASHNPAKYNGIKMCKSGAKPIGEKTGLSRMKELLVANSWNEVAHKGSILVENLLPQYSQFLLSLLPEFSTPQAIAQSKPLKIVIDAGNGMGGYTAPEIFSSLPFEIIPLYFELDGNFPNHEANPIDPENLRDLQKAVIEHKADIGLAFDGDADRCFIVDEKGGLVSPSLLTALIAKRELLRHPGASIIYNLISSSVVPEVVLENGGKPIRSRVGHSFIKAMMAETGAVFGGEHSGHFYFADFWKADSGALAALYAVAELSRSDVALSEVMQPFNRYVASGEINRTVASPQQSIASVKALYEKAISRGENFTLDELDGLTVTGQGYWFNLRPSNTEPLLRLNVEASDKAKMEQITSEVLSLLG